MRGKGPAGISWTTTTGITPAHTGKRTLLLPASARAQDHPRACGEKRRCIWLISSPQGLPPRMRGKEVLSLRIQHTPRITPAHAGKRGTSERLHETAWDYPRACGEKEVTESHDHSEKGLPPRMRGKASFRLSWQIPPGITPAHAGKSSPSVINPCPHRDYPRACGEKPHM